MAIEFIKNNKSFFLLFNFFNVITNNNINIVELKNYFIL